MSFSDSDLFFDLSAPNHAQEESASEQELRWAAEESEWADGLQQAWLDEPEQEKADKASGDERPALPYPSAAELKTNLCRLYPMECMLGQNLIFTGTNITNITNISPLQGQTPTFLNGTATLSSSPLVRAADHGGASMVLLSLFLAVTALHGVGGSSEKVDDAKNDRARRGKLDDTERPKNLTEGEGRGTHEKPRSEQRARQEEPEKLQTPENPPEKNKADAPKPLKEDKGISDKERKPGNRPSKETAKPQPRPAPKPKPKPKPTEKPKMPQPKQPPKAEKRPEPAVQPTPKPKPKPAPQDPPRKQPERPKPPEVPEPKSERPKVSSKQQQQGEKDPSAARRRPTPDEKPEAEKLPQPSGAVPPAPKVPPKLSKEDPARQVRSSNGGTPAGERHESIPEGAKVKPTSQNPAPPSVKNPRRQPGQSEPTRINSAKEPEAKGKSRGDRLPPSRPTKEPTTPRKSKEPAILSQKIDPLPQQTDGQSPDPKPTIAPGYTPSSAKDRTQAPPVPQPAPPELRGGETPGPTVGEAPVRRKTSRKIPPGNDPVGTGRNVRQQTRRVQEGEKPARGKSAAEAELVHPDPIKTFDSTSIRGTPPRQDGDKPEDQKAKVDDSSFDLPPGQTNTQQPKPTSQTDAAGEERRKRNRRLSFSSTASTEMEEEEEDAAETETSWFGSQSVVSLAPYLLGALLLLPLVLLLLSSKSASSSGNARPARRSRESSRASNGSKSWFARVAPPRQTLTAKGAATSARATQSSATSVRSPSGASNTPRSTESRWQQKDFVRLPKFSMPSLNFPSLEGLSGIFLAVLVVMLPLIVDHLNGWPERRPTPSPAYHPPEAHTVALIIFVLGSLFIAGPGDDEGPAEGQGEAPGIFRGSLSDLVGIVVQYVPLILLAAAVYNFANR